MNFKQFFYALLKEEYKWINGDLYKDGIKITDETEIDANQDAEELETIGIRGEYWFDDSGSAIYADGDIGDMNHEAYVIGTCAGQVAAEFGTDADGDMAGINNDSALKERILDTIISELNIEDEDEKDEKIQEIKNDPADAMIQYLINNNNFTKEKATDLVLTAYGSMGDAREYAIKNWGWARVHGDSIETKELTRDSLENIARGLSDAMSQEGLWDRDGIDEEQIYLHEYTISTYSGKRYTITYEDMEKGEVSELEQDISVKKSAATAYLKQMDVSAMPSFYKGLIGDSVEHRNKPPKGYKVIVKHVETTKSGVGGKTKWYDCNVRKLHNFEHNGIIHKMWDTVLLSSGTMFETKQEAYEIGVRRAWDIFEGKSTWS